MRPRANPRTNRLMTLKCRANPLPKGFSRLAAVRLLTVFPLAILLAAGLAACGAEDAQLLPGETAREITANLNTVQRLADEGDCVGAESAALQVQAQVEALGGVDAKLKQALGRGAQRLNEVVATCVPASSEETVEEIVPEVSEGTPAKPKEEKDKKKDKKEEEAVVEPEPEEGDIEPSLPPQAEGEAKGHEKESGSEAEGVESPSGGISPGSNGEGDD